MAQVISFRRASNGILILAPIAANGEIVVHAINDGPNQKAEAEAYIEEIMPAVAEQVEQTALDDLNLILNS